jgi:Tfp pilus assembly protein PilO
MRWLLPVFLIGVGIGGFILITKPMYADIKDLQAEGDAYEQALQNSANLQKERDRLTTKLNSFNPDDLAKLDKMLPDTVDNIKLILEIQEQASNQGIVVKNVQFEPKQFLEENANASSTPAVVGSASTGAPIATTPVKRTATSPTDNADFETFELQFSVEGSYKDFVAFMQLMEKSLRLIDIKSITFTPGTSEKDKKYTDQYKYLFKINTYRLKD